jgi:hypothetical protein
MAHLRMMERAAQSAERAKLFRGLIRNRFDPRPTTTDDDDVFHLRGQPIDHMFDQRPAIQECAAFVAAEAARLPASDDRAQKSQAAIARSGTPSC